MDGEAAPEVQLLRCQKAKLIDILSADADFILQHADSQCLLTLSGYQRVKSCRVPSEKVTELLDHVIQRGPKEVRGLLDLLKKQDLQEAFPMLSYVKDLQVDAHMSTEETSISKKRKASPELGEDIPAQKISSSGCALVTERQLMSVARNIGSSWKEIGVMALDIPSVRLEHIQENFSLHVDRVFAMLRLWRNRQRDKATAAHLHSLLSQEDWELPPESTECLLETSKKDLN